MKGAALLAWARGKAAAWWDARHDPYREPLEVVIAEAYLRGAIDAVDEEVEHERQRGMEMQNRGAAEPASVNEKG